MRRVLQPGDGNLNDGGPKPRAQRGLADARLVPRRQVHARPSHVGCFGPLRCHQTWLRASWEIEVFDALRKHPRLEGRPVLPLAFRLVEQLTVGRVALPDGEVAVQQPGRRRIGGQVLVDVAERQQLGRGFWWCFVPLIAIFSLAAFGRWRSGMNWRAGNCDRLLSGHVAYARHALAIDETRADFDRVKWGSTVQPSTRPDGSPEPFVQLWFAGNHSDVGGSYPEAESRLSDISLSWMVEQVPDIPEPLLLDGSKLNRSPSADGLQACEVAGMKDWLALKFGKWTERFPRLGWTTNVRDIPATLSSTKASSNASGFRASPSVPEAAHIARKHCGGMACLSPTIEAPPAFLCPRRNDHRA